MKKLLAFVILCFLLLIFISYYSSTTPESAKSKSSSSSSSSRVSKSHVEAKNPKKAEPSSSSGYLTREESGHKVKGFDGQTTKIDEETLDRRPDGKRTIKGFPKDLDIHSDSE